MTILTLGQTDISKHVRHPQKSDPARMQRIEEMIRGLEGKALNIEVLPLRMLKIERAQFPVLDLGFLETGMPVEYNGTTIQLPRFSVYAKTKEGFRDFVVNLYKNSSLITGFSGDQEFKVFSDRLANSQGFTDYCRNVTYTYDTTWDLHDYSFEELPRQIRKPAQKKLPEWRNQFSTRFHGLMTEEARKAVATSLDIFGEQTYLIGENSQEHWFKNVISKDFLVAGVLEGKCYLLGRFETAQI